ncbi:hypothetical protein [Mangrovicoccus algicola]|uniref:Lipoprotein n=1 Tax=Mangrovicoccus algicola TaxID=2771008 RepID=A0A8J6YTW5_9RHOB|nr:hypothetical protein [Mangrovicoccus algicola]MBE3639168.1 hypothetical protein [Mangrovicoccus algicola]
MSEPRRWGAALAAAAGLLGLAGCAGPAAQDREALAKLFWTPPASLAAETRLPEGLGTAGPIRLVMVLEETGGGAARSESFTLAPPEGGAQGHRLRRADYRRFSQFQNRVVASIGLQAQVDVELMVPYCRKPAQAPGSGAPVVALADLRDGSVLMSSAAPVSARGMYAQLPACA